MSEKQTWEYFGANNPYYGVGTYEQFRKENLDKPNLKDFFESGEKYINEIWSDIENHFQKDFKPNHALDFGCEVGRLAIPLCKKCKNVLGFDVSSTMISEAKKMLMKKMHLMLNLNYVRKIYLILIQNLTLFIALSFCNT